MICMCATHEVEVVGMPTGHADPLHPTQHLLRFIPSTAVEERPGEEREGADAFRAREAQTVGLVEGATGGVDGQVVTSARSH